MSLEGGDNIQEELTDQYGIPIRYIGMTSFEVEKIWKDEIDIVREEILNKIKLYETEVEQNRRECYVERCMDFEWARTKEYRDLSKDVKKKMNQHIAGLYILDLPDWGVELMDKARAKYREFNIQHPGEEFDFDIHVKDPLDKLIWGNIGEELVFQRLTPTNLELLTEEEINSVIG